ncbi:Hsp20/alpha crystallin family protein [Candidatus Sumerlaeota bacterium]|nr:Hsp20/alpha crystallin family protein [Candidatus Sumerlaeota bacterium]
MNMNMNKLAPWNWFKKEDETHDAALPVRRAAGEARPAHPIEQMHREMDRVFDDFFRGTGVSPWRHSSLASPGWNDNGWLKPSVDISATDQEYAINVELPGVSEKDVQVELSGDTLRISGEKKHEKEENGRDFYSVERSYGAFQRVLAIPDDAQEDGINAAFKNGVMTITIPRKEPGPGSKAKRIEIKSGNSP